MTKRAVKFEVGDERYSLAFTTNALSKFEDETGMAVLDVAASFEGGKPSIKLIRALFYAGLVGDYSLEGAGDLIDDLGLEAAANILGEALGRAFPKAEPTAKGGDKGNVP